MKKLTVFLSAVIMLLSAAVCFAQSGEVYVSPDGNDKNPGTRALPVKNIERAIELSQNGGVRHDIVLLSGTHRLKDTVKIENNALPINITGEEGAYVTMTQNIPKKAFSAVTDKDVLKRLPENARGKVRAAALSKYGIEDFGAVRRVERHKMETPSSPLLIQNGKMQTLAEWPNKAFTKIKNTASSGEGYLFEIDEARPMRWEGAKDFYAYGNFNFDWADETFTIKTADLKNSRFETAAQTVHGIADGGEVRFINLLEELDSPGEWYLDRESGVLYVYPLNTADAEFTASTEPLFLLSGAARVTFKNIIFEGTCGCGVVMENSNENTVTECEFQNIGQQAVYIKNGKENTISKNYMHDIGKGCVLITGGDKKTLSPSKNIITNNHMERFAVIGKRYCEAVGLLGVGDVVSHNRIHNTPHYVIRFMGNDNIIEYNDIYDAVTETGDAGALYAGRSWTNGGNVIRNNYFHDFKMTGKSGRSAIYCDDYMTGVSVYDNLFENLTTGITLHSAQYCDVENNIFLNILGRSVYLFNIDNSSDEEALSHSKKALDMYNAGRLEEDYRSLYPKSKEMFELYMFRDYTPDNEYYNTKYPYLRDILKGDYILAPRGNVVKNNVSLGGKFDITSGIAQKTGTIENNLALSKGEEGKLPEINREQYGIEGETEAKLKQFSLISPANGETGVDAGDVVLSWEDISGADKYRLTVARDSAFTDIVYDDVLYDTYRRFRNLSFGETTYYWRVEAIASSYLYKDENKRFSDGGFFTFTTAAKDDTALSEEKLYAFLANVREIYQNLPESENTGELIAGAHLPLEREMKKAQEILLKPTKTNKALENALENVKSAVTVFENSTNPEYINIEDFIKQGEMWSKNTALSGGTAVCRNDGSYGFNGSIKQNTVLKMRARFFISPGGYTSIGLRSAANTTEPWNTREYIFLVKENVIELQRFNGAKRFFFETENKYIKNGESCEIEFGTVTEGGGVRITLFVNGEKLYDYLDTEDAVKTSGKLHIYNNGGSGVEIEGAKADIPKKVSGKEKTYFKLAEIVKSAQSGERPIFPIKDNGHWAFYAVKSLFENGRLEDGSAFLNDLDLPLTRAEFIKTLLSVFDVSYDGDFIKKAMDMGVVKEQKDGFITREEAAVMMYRMIKQDPLYEIYPAGGAYGYADGESIKDYAKEAVKELSKGKILKGENGFFYPKRFITAGEAAALLTK